MITQKYDARNDLRLYRMPHGVQMRQIVAGSVVTLLNPFFTPSKKRSI